MTRAAPTEPRFAQIDLGAGVRAAFTDARGGLSAGPWAGPGGHGLNVGLATGDDVAIVAANRALISQEMGAPVMWATQIHGADVHRVTRPLLDSVTSVGEFDALITSRTDVALGVYVADCVPILLADPVARVVAAVHAGRVGLAKGVLRATLAAMAETGSRLTDIRAAIGPSACGRCYEVPVDLRAEIAGDIPAVWSTTSWGTAALDLPAGVAAQLAEHRVTSVFHDSRCTIEDESLFSHRRATAKAAQAVHSEQAAQAVQTVGAAGVAAASGQIRTGRSSAVVRLLPECRPR